MRLAIRALGLELLSIDASTDDEPTEGGELAGGTCASYADRLHADLWRPAMGAGQRAVIDTYATAKQPNVVHVQPCSDLIEHSHGLACICGPEVEAVTAGLVHGEHRSTTHVGWLVTHHALDGRA